MEKLDINKIPLQGRHIIEASAGTGKTYNITELYIRLLLEKKLLPKNILVMTFTKDATQEIIGRLEQKLRERLLDYPKDTAEYKHLKKSLLNIDESAIFTIHGFCKKVLSEQAFAGGLDIGVSMEVNTDDLLLAVTEEYFRKFINTDEKKFKWLQDKKCYSPNKFLYGSGQSSKGFADIIKSNIEIFTEKVLSNEELYLQKQIVLDCLESNKHIVEKFIAKTGKGEPEDQRDKEYSLIINWLNDKSDRKFPQEVECFVNGNKIKAKDTKPVLSKLKDIKELYQQNTDNKIYSFVKQICLDLRHDFKNLKAKNAVLDFNDLIIKLRDALKNSPELILTLQKDYPIALIDEFQDTDAEQYEILDTIYSLDKSELLLLMIGDPKQAIYSFRGGDIYTYLRAKQSAEYIWTMDTNWRSTTQMISAYNRIFYKSDILENSDDYKNDVFSKDIGYQIIKAGKDYKSDNSSAISYFYYNGDTSKTDELRLNLSKWTANEIVRLLNSKQAQENDIAVLVNSGNEAKIVSQELKKLGLSSVYLSNKENIYKTNEAEELYRLLQGINNYQNEKFLKQALATSFLGKTTEDFLNYKSDDSLKWQNDVQRVKELYKTWTKHGVMALIMELLHHDFICRYDNKERILTNILHLAELVKIAENKYKSKNQIINWFDKQIHNENSSTEEELRLESEANLIKIITIHGSKGLEYPIVFVPFVSDAKSNISKAINKISSVEKIYYQIGEDDRVLKLVKQQAIEESVRKLYVAITRAVKKCYIGVADFKNSKDSPLAQLLDYSNFDGWEMAIKAITDNPANYSDLTVFDKVRELKYQSRQNSINLDNLQAKIFKGEIKKNWQMISFSSIVKSQYSHYSSPLDSKLDEVSDDYQDREKQELRFRATKGADIGNLLHNILEQSDFSKPLNDDIIREQMVIYKVIEDKDFNNLKSWLNDILNAEIINLQSNEQFKLKDLPMDKTLREAEFYLPIVNKSLFKKDLYQILSKHRKSTINIEIDNHKIFGMLHGFIDLIFEHNGRFYIADYKSNYLGDELSDYNQQAMELKNQQSMYDLQYLLYSVALHRFLQSNLDDYDFDKHFGGVYYLYLRGFKDGYGAYYTVPESRLIFKLNDLFKVSK